MIDPQAVDLSKRNFMTVGGLALVSGLALSAPACPGGVTKEKAVRVAGFAIELSKEAIPLLHLIGGEDVADLFEGKAIPALEKLKEALSKADVPTGGTALQTVRSVLSGIRTALNNLPSSPRVTTITGILASISVLLLTVEAFIDSEMPAVAVSLMSTDRRAEMTNSITKVLEAVKP